MRTLGALFLAILVAVVAIWLAIKLLIGLFKLVGILIGVALAVGVYMVAEKLVGAGR